MCAYECQQFRLCAGLKFSYFSVAIDREGNSNLCSDFMDHPPFLKSSEIAAALGISRRTLALWVKQGRVPEPQRSEAGYLLWSDADLLNLRGVTKRSPGPQPTAAGRRNTHAA